MEFNRFYSSTLLFDPNGSAVASSNSSVEGVSYFTVANWSPTLYSSYGQLVWTPTPPPSSPAVLSIASSQPFQYKGQYGCYTDATTGLVYCINRYYDPNVGRWMSRDPSGLDGGVNVYGYLDGDPVDGADPDGLQGPSLMDRFFSTTFGQMLVGENWGRGFRTSRAALATVVSNTVVDGVKFSSPILHFVGSDNWHGWDGGSNRSAPGFRGSTIAWDVAGYVGPVAFGGLISGAAKGAEAGEGLIAITRWDTPEGLATIKATGLKEGSFVMRGNASPAVNYVFSGVYEGYVIPGSIRYPLASRITTMVPESVLGAPSGWQRWKWLIGQAVLKEGVHF